MFVLLSASPIICIIVHKHHIKRMSYLKYIDILMFHMCYRQLYISPPPHTHTTSKLFIFLFSLKTLENSYTFCFSVEVVGYCTVDIQRKESLGIPGPALSVPFLTAMDAFFPLEIYQFGHLTCLRTEEHQFFLGNCDFHPLALH